jgi:hypothetical protein
MTTALSLQQVQPSRVRFSPKEKARVREYLDLVQGHKCSLCPNVTGLEIDHKNGLDQNRLTDYRWLCKSCNLSQRNLGDRTGLASVSVPSSPGDEDAMEKNRRTEGAWVEFISANLGYGPLPKERLTGMSAYQIGISVSTVNRHWKKYASDLGPFRIYRPNQGTSLLVELRKKP